MSYYYDALAQLNGHLASIAESLGRIAECAENPKSRTVHETIQYERQPDFTWPACVKCGSNDHAITFLPIGYRPPYDELYGDGFIFRDAIDKDERTVKEWLRHYCRGCRRAWLTPPRDRVG